MRTRKITALSAALLVAAALAATGCSKLGFGTASSPTATFKAFFEAAKKKDAEGMKKTMSKGSATMLESFAKMQNKTLDEALKEGMNDPATSSANLPETRNEKIEGDNATLEIKDDKSGKWLTMPFVKEEGQWKLAFDKFIQDAFKQMGEQMKKQAPTMPNMNPTTPGANANSGGANSNDESDEHGGNH